MVSGGEGTAGRCNAGPRASVSEIARSAGIHVSQLFRWRKELCRMLARHPSRNS
ncbi:transposase [Mesorhizobium sp. ORM8.1]